MLLDSLHSRRFLGGGLGAGKIKAGETDESRDARPLNVNVNINVILTQLKLLQNSVTEFHSFIFYEMLSL